MDDKKKDIDLLQKKEVLICNNCKEYWIAPTNKCECGSTTLTITHENNYKLASNRVDEQTEKSIAEIGDTISWEFDNNGKKYSAQVAMIDFEEKHYCVYADYGQDLIEFDHATIERTNNR